MSEAHPDVHELLLLSGFSAEALQSLSFAARQSLELVFSESSETVIAKQVSAAAEEPTGDPPVGSPVGLASWIVDRAGIGPNEIGHVSSTELRNMAAVVVEAAVEQAPSTGEQSEEVPGLLTLLFLREGFEGSQKIEPDMREDTLRADARQIAEQIQAVKQALGGNALRAKIEQGRTVQTPAPAAPPPDEVLPKPRPKSKSNRMPKFVYGEEVVFARRILRGPRKGWWNGAACKGSDPEPYFVEGAAQNSVAALCRHCPVMLDCRLDALQNYEEFGVWGGWTEYSRRAWMQYVTANWGNLASWAEDIIGQWQAAQAKSAASGQARPATPKSKKPAKGRRTPPNSAGDPEIPAQYTSATFRA